MCTVDPQFGSKAIRQIPVDGEQQRDDAVGAECHVGEHVPGIGPSDVVGQTPFSGSKRRARAFFH